MKFVQLTQGNGKIFVNMSLIVSMRWDVGEQQTFMTSIESKSYLVVKETPDAIMAKVDNVR